MNLHHCFLTKKSYICIFLCLTFLLLIAAIIPDRWLLCLAWHKGYDKWFPEKEAEIKTSYVSKWCTCIFKWYSSCIYLESLPCPKTKRSVSLGTFRMILLLKVNNNIKITRDILSCWPVSSSGLLCMKLAIQIQWSFDSHNLSLNTFVIYTNSVIIWLLQGLLTVVINWHSFDAEKITLTSFTDWGPKIDVVGFCFLDLASNYKPPEPLLKWLESGDKPIYIGFGSLVSSDGVLPKWCIFVFHPYIQIYDYAINSLLFSNWLNDIFGSCGSIWPLYFVNMSIFYSSVIEDAWKVELADFLLRWS